MSEQTKLEVSIPLKVATSQLMHSQFRTHIRRLMRQNDGINVSGFRKEPLSLFIDAAFPDRSKALNAVKAIRRLSLEHARESAKNFTYIIDNDELLFFNIKDDEYSFQSKNVTEEIQEWYESSLSESPVVP